MSRQKKAGLGYFPLDTGFFEDKRIRRLTARFGADGPLFYIYVLCKAYSNCYYVEHNDDFCEDAALDLGCSADKIGLMLHYLLDKSLLDCTLFNTVKVLSSHGIQSQFQAIKKSLKRDVEVDGSSWILEESETEGFIKVRHPENKSGINADKSGINDTKEKEKKNESKSETQREGKEREEGPYPALSCPGVDERANTPTEPPDEPDFIKRARSSWDSIYGEGSFDEMRRGGYKRLINGLEGEVSD